MEGGVFLEEKMCHRSGGYEERAKCPRNISLAKRNVVDRRDLKRIRRGVTGVGSCVGEKMVGSCGG